MQYQQWSRLWLHPGFNAGETLIRTYSMWDSFNPLQNKNARIVYVYRNPLDHFISYWRHAQNHIDASHRTRVMANGTKRLIKNLHEFVFEASVLEGFVKHYYTFKKMKLKFPANIVMIPYESLVTNPAAEFHKILLFMNASFFQDSQKLRLLEDTLLMCSKEALKRIESNLNRALGGDQKENGRHINNGEIGKWRNHFSVDEVEEIECFLNKFDISLNEFKLSA